MSMNLGHLILSDCSGTLIQVQQEVVVLPEEYQESDSCQEPHQPREQEHFQLPVSLQNRSQPTKSFFLAV